MSLAKVELWETKLRTAFDKVDHELEKRYSGKFRLKPGRPADREGVTRDADGLFDISVAYSAGFGSEHGEGYVFKIRIATYDHVPAEVKSEIEAEALKLLSKELRAAFPNKELRIEKENDRYKIVGDLSLE